MLTTMSSPVAPVMEPPLIVTEPPSDVRLMPLVPPVDVSDDRMMTGDPVVSERPPPLVLLINTCAPLAWPTVEDPTLVPDSAKPATLPRVTPCTSLPVVSTTPPARVGLLPPAVNRVVLVTTS